MWILFGNTLVSQMLITKGTINNNGDALDVPGEGYSQTL